MRTICGYTTPQIDALELPEVYELWEYWSKLSPQGRAAIGVDFKAILEAAGEPAAVESEQVMSLADFMDRIPEQQQSVTPDMLRSIG